MASIENLPDAPTRAGPHPGWPASVDRSEAMVSIGTHDGDADFRHPLLDVMAAIGATSPAAGEIGTVTSTTPQEVTT